MAKTPTPRGGVDGQAANSQDPQTAPRARVDWEKIEHEYRAGVLSVREIGRRHGVSNPAILKRAKRDGWERDLTEKVRKAVSTALVSTTVSSANARADALTERQIVREAAATVVEIVQHHRKDIRHGHRIVSRLLEQLDTVSDARDALQALIELETEIRTNAEDGTEVIVVDGRRRAAMLAAVSLPEHANTARILSMALRNLTVIERQAYAIENSPPPDPPDPEAEDDETDVSLDAFVDRLNTVLAAHATPNAEAKTQA